jgi:DNA-binding SARP family transcriptional activator/tetratricopeptide (TPR) repeat protein
MRFYLLGPVMATVGGQPVTLEYRRERLLLALLLLDAGKPVAVERLTQLLWEDDLPRDPRGALQVSVCRLRRCLAAAQAGPGQVTIVCGPGGYAVQADPDSVDASQFTRQVAQAQEIPGPAERSRALVAALGLWRGEPLADVAPEQLRRRVCRHLTELRTVAMELRVEADLRCGRHTELLSELTSVTAEYPTSERLVAARMVALYRGGRQRDALAVYEDTANVLAEQVGLDPGEDLRNLRTAILRNDPRLMSGGWRLDGSVPSVLPPAELPLDVRRFAGRQFEQSALAAALQAGPGRSALVVTICGMPGIGKTALAVRLAHQAAPSYPDGQLFVDLHGFTDGIDPVSPDVALDRLLRVLGSRAEDIPETLDGRAAAYRSYLAGRRMLIVLDNAVSQTQIEPLLPAAAGCLVLVTSRLTLAGLDDALSLPLDVLDPPDAVTLLAQLVDNPGAVTEQADAAAEVVQLCGYLPLAIRLVASRLRHRRPWTLAYLAERLRGSGDRLGEFQAGERSVTAALRTSFHGLPAEQQQLFRLLGLNPCPRFDAHATAALAGLSAVGAERLLEQLVDTNLVEQPATGRYQFHDLVKLFAATVAAEAPLATRHLVMERLIRYYLWGAGEAKTTLAPYSHNRRLLSAMADSTFPPFADYAAAFGWLETERENLLTVAVAAAGQGLPDMSRTLSEALFCLFELGAHFDDGLRLYECVARAMRQSGDDIGAATALRSCGVLARHLGRSHEALEFLHQAHIVIARREPSLHHASVLINLGELLTDMGSLAEATSHFQQALAIIRASADRMGEEYCLRLFSRLQWMRGQHAEAIASASRAAQLSHAGGHHSAEAYAHLALGSYLRQLGRHNEALHCLERAGQLWALVVDPTGESLTLSELAATYSAMRRPGDARAELNSALRIALEAGDRGAEFEALLGIGEAARDTDDLNGSVHHCRAAADLASSLGRPRDIVRARSALAHTYLTMGRADRAIAQWEWTLREHGTSQIAEIDDIRLRLAASAGKTGGADAT